MSKEKTIDTLPQDIYNLFEKGKKIPREEVQSLANRITNILQKRLDAYRKVYRHKPDSVFHFSNIGKGKRFLWYAYRDEYRFLIPPRMRFIMLYGDILEELFLFFAEQAGHKVEGKQDRLTIGKARGKRDAKIDGINTELKSTSPFQFPKFKSGEIKTDLGDPYGYKAQVQAYAQADSKKPFEEYDEECAIVAVNKSTGEIFVVKFDALEQQNIEELVKEVEKAVKNETKPSRCYPDLEFGKKGNRVLHANCVHCPYKFDCWKDKNNGEGLRAFKYEHSVKYFTNVEDQPRVEELDLSEKKEKSEENYGDEDVAQTTT